MNRSNLKNMEKTSTIAQTSLNIREFIPQRILTENAFEISEENLVPQIHISEKSTEFVHERKLEVLVMFKFFTDQVRSFTMLFESVVGNFQDGQN
ncbi:hypothetical protein QTO34_001966 [Cnephaeus nilssonii]|uniref:Uncharacterized protein n=1 Tax=Cnephaeus nilssonii TaxID=3371016 RepID=A0AA40HUV5_CNENI|nr:hypothetical protein QTO34_001966 [Eptesicus nilssonii]